jgi:hypothetical protein
MNCEFLSSIDLFGKEPELYFRNKPIKTSWIGLIFTISYIILYIAFFIYKLLRMLSRVDVTFYDTYAYHDIPSIHLTPENFYGGFAIGYHINETIYYPKAYFYSGTKEEAGWNWKYQVIELEPCKLEKFGKNYQELFKDKPLETLYCLKDVNFTLEGYANLNVYSYIYVEFYPCNVTTADGRSCQPQEYIKGYFRENILEFKMQDMELSPEIYKTPMKPTEKDINTPVYRDLHQHIYSYLQIIFLETDEDLIGFDAFSKTKKEQFIKYDESWLIAAPPKGEMFTTDEPICDVSLQLAAKVLTQRRTYVKLIEILGDVGGLMEFIWSLFSIITVIICDILYEKSFVNDLFSFDLFEKKVILKEKKLNSDNNNSPIIYNKGKHKDMVGIFLKGSKPDKNSFDQKMDEDMKDVNKKENEIAMTKQSKGKRKRKMSIKTNYSFAEPSENKKIVQKTDQLQSENPDILKIQKNEYEISQVNDYDKQINNDNDNDNSNDSKNSNKKSINQRRIDHVKLNDFCIYCCFLCVRKRKNLENILLNEGMQIIRDHLDIVNIFKNMYIQGLIHGDMNLKKKDMSDECKKNLSIYKFHGN